MEKDTTVDIQNISDVKVINYNKGDFIDIILYKGSRASIRPEIHIRVHPYEKKIKLTVN